MLYFEAMPKYKGAPRTELERFMRLVGATGESVAEATGLTQPTVWRAAVGQCVPTYSTWEKITRWAEREAKRQGVPVRKRLRWDGGAR